MSFDLSLVELFRAQVIIECSEMIQISYTKKYKVHLPTKN